MRRRHALQAWVAGLALFFAAIAPAQTPTPPAPTSAAVALRIVGGLAGLTQYTQLEAPFWTQQLAQLSAGRYRADIVPFDRAGIPGSEMLRLMQLGVVPFGTLLLSQWDAQRPPFLSPDLPGLALDMEELRAVVRIYRPYLQALLRKEFGIELLSIYVYPAQMLFCKNALTQLAQIAGRRVRISSTGQADFLQALGATPVRTAFSHIVHSLQTGDTECAITGSMPGHTLGLYRHTTYLYPLPITWGLAIFGAHLPTWNALPPELRTLLQRELPLLEEAIWNASLRDTTQGIHCNRGSAQCPLAEKGHMHIVPVAEPDYAHIRQVLRSSVLPRALERCGSACANLWVHQLAPLLGLDANPPK